MIENTDKMVAAILAAAKFQKSTLTSIRSIVDDYDECLAAITSPRPRKPSVGEAETRGEQQAWDRHAADHEGG